ncbi:hypothetical protein FACS1894154_07900 [Betaproteobacteria bacterium]|nr:hypothetical protein FACS1894154_07900 [Betaproteobacteria bacterium]GHU12287.1 hypothetical protein AGMMS50225_19870 [Betaproteobacteria bacterium]
MQKVPWYRLLRAFSMLVTTHFFAAIAYGAFVVFMPLHKGYNYIISGGELHAIVLPISLLLSLYVYCFTCSVNVAEHSMSDGLREYIKLCGLNESKIDKFGVHVRMYHDLGVYGNAALSCLEILKSRFQVDLSDFQFDRFFPRECVKSRMLAHVLRIPLVGALVKVRLRDKYLPLSLDMIDDAIRERRWNYMILM